MKYKQIVLIFLFLLVSFGISSAYLFLPEYFQSLDSRVRDFYFKVRGTQSVDERIIIIDIDEKSIKELGQWPWERDKFAHILYNLKEKGVGIIGLDIIFSEADKTSPTQLAKKFSINEKNLPDYDLILSQAISQTPTIVGSIFDFDNKNLNEGPQIPAIFIQKNKTKEYLPQAKGVLTNIALIQEKAYSSGFMNNIPDESGIIRSVPMFISYDMEIYPSLAVEMFRIIQNASRIMLLYGETGIYDITFNKNHIKSDRFAKLYLNFRGPFKSYKYISAVDVYNNTVDSKDIAGKFAFIGTSAYGLMDLRSTPMDSVIAGVELHANMLDNLLHDDMLYRPQWSEIADLAMIFFLSFIIIFLFVRVSVLVLIPLFSSTVILYLVFNYNILFNQHIILNSIFPMLSIVFSLVGVLGVNYFFESRQKEIIKHSFSKKVSSQVMDDLLKNPEATDLSAKEEVVSIYFSDIRSFTSISEKLASPRRITSFLNEYMEIMAKPIEESSGTIDKYIGDAVMAYWNAPLLVKNHADMAVQTALKQVAMRDEINIHINKEYGFDVDYGIGINTGKVIVGEIGSKGRSDYTIIGDAVNIASRLEGLCKIYKVRLIISEFTYQQLKEKYVVAFLDIVRVKGKQQPVKVYEVISMGEASDKKTEELDNYEKAYQAYLNAEFIEAKICFELLFKKYKKYLYILYQERCEYLERSDTVTFNGIFEFTSK